MPNLPGGVASEKCSGLEKLRVTVCPKAEWVRLAAARVAEAIRARGPAPAAPLVLALSRGAAQGGVYAELARLHREEGLSFANVRVFATDEFYPIGPAQQQSTRAWLGAYLLDRVDLPAGHVHLLDGAVAEADATAHCEAYERRLAEAGGVDVLVLGLGMAYNDAGSSPKSDTRLVYIDPAARAGWAADFFGVDNVPRRALTMGLGTLLGARAVLAVGIGEGSAKAVLRLAEGPAAVREFPLSHLQGHPGAEVICDPAAAAELSRHRCPWVALGNRSFALRFDEPLERKATIWLSLHTGKPILKLTEGDYAANSLLGLVQQRGPVHHINVRVFTHLSRTITGWPGGKPAHPDQLRAAPRHQPQPSGSPRAFPPGQDKYVGTGLGGFPASSDDGAGVAGEGAAAGVVVGVGGRPYPLRVAIFSPHPDDDVISMGGTFMRLVEQGHEVHVVYQTSGDNAVWDDEVKRFARFATQYARHFGLDAAAAQAVEDRLNRDLDSRVTGQPPTHDVLRTKALIRFSEAWSAAQYCGVPTERIHFLDMPFYETGGIVKQPLGEEDVRRVRALLEAVRPHQIYAAGDLSDPHGTHRVCLKAVVQALEQLSALPAEAGGAGWVRECQTWLYRGAWQEWEPDLITMAVPMSPEELLAKRYAIFKHQSQKDLPPFPGSDAREFWQRSECRNRETAKLYDRLGLTEYEAMEAFVLLRLEDKDSPIYNI